MPNHPNNDALQLDSHTLWFLLGAMLDAVKQAGPIATQSVKKNLENKARNIPAMGDALKKVMEVLDRE